MLEWVSSVKEEEKGCKQCASHRKSWKENQNDVKEEDWEKDRERVFGVKSIRRRERVMECVWKP